MSEPVWLVLLSIAVGLLSTLVGWFGSMIWRQVSENRAKLSQVGEFLGRDTEREKAWWEWRRQLEADRRERVVDVYKRLDGFSEALRELEQRMARHLGDDDRQRYRRCRRGGEDDGNGGER